MTRHKKFVKSEKAKTKLKATKLPKGLNVTKTDFKIKKIIIREQIRDTSIIEDSAVIHSQNIKDLLSKLHHHNNTNRNEGLRYLKELVTNHPQEASKHLSAIIQGISQLCLDVDKDVRRECYKALNLVLASQTPAVIAPFFGTISSYLRCAMTHIHIQIQEDSLFMLDCLLLYMPSLVAANSDSIFSSFLDMISKLRVESKPERTLTVNLESKLTTVKWRSKVLDRLLGILRAIVHEWRHRNSPQRQGVRVHYQNAMEVENAFEKPETLKTPTAAHNPLTRSFTAQKQCHYPLIRYNLNRTCDLPFLLKKSMGSTATSANLMVEKDEGIRIRRYAELLMPLLFETWMEVRPTSLNNTTEVSVSHDDVHISNEAAFTLKTTLEIIEKLHELITFWDEEVNNQDLSDWFRNSYNKEYSTQFLRGYPYVQSDGYKGNKKKSKGAPTEQDVQESGGTKCFLQNLNISYIFCCLNWNVSKIHSNFAEKIISFLKNNIERLDSQNQEVSFALVKVLRAILLINGESWMKSNIGVKDLLKQIMSVYHRGKFSKEIRPKILILLCDIVLQFKLSQLYGNELFESWLSTLPKMLCQPYISQHVLKTFFQLARQQNEIFLKHLAKDIQHIIDNLPKIQVAGFDDQLEGKKLIINLFYWLGTWDDQSELITFDEESKTINKYVNDLMLLKNF